MLDTQKIIDGYIQQSSWRIKENANASYSYSGMVGHVANFATSDYALSHIYSEEMARAHKDTMMHIHDLSGGMACYCLGMDLEQLLNRGLDDIDGPPKHLTSALSQMMNLVFLVSQEIAGACAFNSVDTLLSPYVYKDKLTYHQIKQAVQEFIYSVNVKGRIGYQSPFLNVQFDITVPNRKKDTYAVAGNESLDVKYEDLTWERESIVRAFLETIMESKRVLTFPVMNIGITKDFNWDNKLSDVIFECIGKTGQPTINNYVNGDYDPDAVKSMCCSLRLDIKQVLKQVGGQFGAADNSGSIGVVTLNLPLYGYLSGGDKDILYEYVARYMCLAWESLKCKRRFIEDKMQIGFYPTLHRFVEDFRHFFNTIGVVGMNEMLLNMGKPNISDPESKQFCMELLEYMNDVISQFQERDCDFYGTRQGLIGNVELVPGEGISHRLAKHLRNKYPDAVTSNGTDGEYITRGCWLPADEEYSLMFAAKHQEDLQNLFSGGANFQYHLGEPIYDIKPVKSILRKLITKTKLPFISLSPAIEVCPVCGRVSTLDGWCEHELTEEQIDSLTKQGVELRG